MRSNLKSKVNPAILYLKAIINNIIARLVVCIFLGAAISINNPAMAGDGGVDDPISVSRLTGTSGSTGLLLNNTAVMSFTRQNEQSRFVRNIITLAVIEETPYYIPANFTATVGVKIEYGPSAASLNIIANQLLTVTYNKDEGIKYNAKNYFHFSGAEYVKITIVQAPTGTVGGIDLKNLLTLENEMRATRYYDMTVNTQPSSLSGTPPVSGDDEFMVSWLFPASAANTHTQLEWTWVEDELITSYYTAGSLDVNLLFKNNSTRIDLPRNILSYKIPLLYGGTGKVYYRVRAVELHNDGSRRDAAWSTMQFQGFAGHNDSLNWQSTTAYSEEGKRYTVVQYYDGSLRNRQTVTKDNVNNTAIIAETFYDGQGRAAIQVLPSPGIKTIISYTKNLNRFNLAVDEDPAAYFDFQPVSTPNSIVPPMVTDSGASRYYSTSNPEKNKGFNQAIPDAEGYPYSVIRYTPDGTGRVMAESRPGAAFQMGKGHEVKYFYGNPSQEELDGLFGTEVGNWTHYFKTMVKDQNGQMHITYSDMHGRTIATALAGSAPVTLDSLNYGNPAYYPGQAGTSINRNLLNSNTNIVKGTSLEAINTLLVPVTTAYQFRYELNPESLQLAACNTSSICYDCMYDLEISVTDESGDGAPIIRRYNNISLTADDNCSTGIQGFKNESGTAIPGNIINFSETLTPGSYVVRKTLTLSETSLQRYKDMYLTPTKGLCKTEQELIDSVYNVLLATSDCNTTPGNTCTACTTALGTYSSFKVAYLASIGNPPVTSALEAQLRSMFINDSINCTRLCNTTTTSQTMPLKRQLMLADMIPYSGQYASQTAPSPPDGVTMYNKYNIFSTTNPSTQPFYKKPWDKNKLPDFYRTISGTVDLVIHPGPVPDNTLLNATTANDFAQLFAYPWAEALLSHHPEYDRLVFAETNLTTSYNWINAFSNTPTYSDAVIAGYIFTSNANLNDPFFTAAPGLKPAMVTKLNDQHRRGLSLWQIAYGQVKCKDIVSDAARATCYQSAAKVPPYANITTAPEQDQLWVAFRNLYGVVRDSMVNAYIASSVAMPDAQTLVNEKYILRFANNDNQLAQQFGNDWSWYPASPGADPVLTNLPSGSTPAQTYSSRCSSYINQWRNALLQCATLNARGDKETILTQITNGMVAVCQKGSNESNPYGSSDVAPSTPIDGSPRSFEEVIMNVFNSYGIPKDSLCNPFVIEFPKPYGKGPVFTKDIITQIDTCNCSRFAKLKAEAITAGKDPNVLGSFNQYLSTAYGDTLTAVLYNAMMQNCGNIGFTTCTTNYTYTQVDCNYSGPLDCGCYIDATSTKAAAMSSAIVVCNIVCPVKSCTTALSVIPLPSPQPMPEFLKCGFVAGSRCVTCAQLSTLTNDFKTWFPAPYNAGPVFTGTDLTPTNIRDNNTFQRFINYRTGFQFNWMEYAQAASIAGCDMTIYPNNGATQTVICRDSKVLTDTTGIIANEPPCQKVYNQAIALAQNIYQQRKEVLLANFEAAYRAKCMSAKDSFTVTYTNKEYHYTLFYYDMGGNMVKTVSPKGVNPDFSSGFVSSAEAGKKNNTFIPRLHSQTINYRYNSIGNVITQNSPDGNTFKVWYDRLGRLAISQNAQQALDGKYSYFLYDYFGRTVETGQKSHTTPMTQAISQDSTALKNWILNTGSTRDQIIFTVYDNPYTPLTGTYVTQKNLRGRVSYRGTKNVSTDPDYYTATFCTYDVHGNIDTLVQDYRGIPETGTTDRFKRITYDYDLISNNIKMVSYQSGYADSFFHRNSYDASNRLISVESSRDKIVWEREAAYTYYKHGELARMELGQLRLQGIDYAYTLQGWLKGINSTNISKVGFDIGRDGLMTGSVVSPVAIDIFGTALHYYDAVEGPNTWIDYKPIDNDTAFFARPATSAFSQSSLYNGNIAAMTVNNAGLLKGASPSTNSLPLFYQYRYDQLDRLKAVQTYRGLRINTNVWDSSFIGINDYKEAITYDPNGNILTYNRKGAPTTGGITEMDDLAYNYYGTNNQLKQVTDNAVFSGNYPGDMDNQTNTTNYIYDAAGNLKSSVADTITNVTWNIYGKITSITKNGRTTTYTYDAKGDRITRTAGGKLGVYIRDATGHSMSVYEKEASTIYRQTEVYLYGSDQLGIVGEKTATSSTLTLAAGYGVATINTFIRGEKSMEVKNHLGNVMVAISDKKIQRSSNGTTLEYYTADIITAQDYYPSGMTMPGRQVNGSGYRYGFNGQEQSTELYSGNNLYTATFWEYDSRVSMRWNPDPKPDVNESPYVTFKNNPIWFVDPNGDSSVIDDKGYIVHYDKNDKDLRVFMQVNGKLQYVGKLGGQIDATVWFKNLVMENAVWAHGLVDPWTFKNFVRQNGRWDLKNLNESNDRVKKTPTGPKPDLKEHIIGIAFFRRDPETNKKNADPNFDTRFTFNNETYQGKTYQGLLPRPEDLNNYHFGIVGKAFGLFAEEFMLRTAGAIEMEKAAKDPDKRVVPASWRPSHFVEEIRVNPYIPPYVEKRTSVVLDPPYGDNPDDHEWIKRGFNYYKTNKKAFIRKFDEFDRNTLD
jgi:YD repeat-containing protein